MQGQSDPANLVFVLDNAKIHSPKDLDIEAKRFGSKILMLPTYSPELNMAELVIRHLKSRFKKERALFK